MVTVGDAFDCQYSPSQLLSSPDLTVIQGFLAVALDLTERGDSKALPAWIPKSWLPQDESTPNAGILIG
jgi:hypothetical protein